MNLHFCTLIIRITRVESYPSGFAFDSKRSIWDKNAIYRFAYANFTKMRWQINANWLQIQIQRKFLRRMIFLDMASKFVSYHFSLKITFHAYTNYRIPRLRRLSLFSWESLVRWIYTPYQRILRPTLFDAKFSAEFEFEVKIFQESIWRFCGVMSVRCCFRFKKKYLKKNSKMRSFQLILLRKLALFFRVLRMMYFVLLVFRVMK